MVWKIMSSIHDNEQEIFTASAMSLKWSSVLRKSSIQFTRLILKKTWQSGLVWSDYI